MIESIPSKIMNDTSEKAPPEEPKLDVVTNHFGALTPQEKYAIVLGRLEHEHELTNSRMSWLLTFQGFLFATIAVSTKDGKLICLSPDFFHYVVPLIGLGSSLAVFLGIVASRLARRRLKTIWRTSGIVGFPELSPSPIGAWLGAIPGLGVPAIIALAWSYLLLSPLPNSTPVVLQTPLAGAIAQTSTNALNSIPISGTNVPTP